MSPIDLIFTEKDHEYKFRGRVVPSVTQVLQPLTKLWTNGADLERARQEGKAIHSMVELECKGEDYDCPQWLWPYKDAWQKFASDTGFIMTHSEHKAFNETFGYAGQLDLAGTLTKVKDSPSAVIDIKRTLGAKTVGLQLAAYEHLLTGKRRRFGLQLEPLRFREYDDPSDWGAFLAALTIYRWREKNA